MKQTFKLFAVALIAGAFTLIGYKYFVENTEIAFIQQNENPPTINTSYSTTVPTELDFTEAAEKTIHAVVHVKNTTMARQNNSIQNYFFGGGQPRAMVGTGSGVIISADGYIITNNHVIENSSQLEVTLNNNKTYSAELIGTDPATDIALIKIDADEELAYIPFGDSNNLKIGEWVLAVGNPFNLTSTVTAGIVSAKSRDLNEMDGKSQSFIQTDAAVNRGNSGGALVNTRGELVGINTAITSETGSYVGYSFAVPSNNARKVIEDIMEYGNVQRGILGITGGSLNTNIANQLGIDETEGVYVDGVETGSGADKGGIEKGDIIKNIDGLKIGKFADLVGYLGSKHPNDTVQVTLLRDGSEKVVPVTLVKLDTYEIEYLGLEIKNSNPSELKNYGVDHGVKVNRALNNTMKSYDLENTIILKLNDFSISSIDDVKNVMNQRNYNEPVKMTFVTENGEVNTFIFR
ncbi:MAG: trypsin-like peptidase domain-containing protein [Flavobacteriaceae bacterium]|nr:trypsin-like peptidase domain-containing protein [Flavobacteriaceae bacterium]